MTTIVRFEDIEAWQTARELTKMVYLLSAKERFAKDFGLRDQMRRAAVSIMSNIAEGFENQSRLQFIRFLGIAKGSAGELRSQAYVAFDLTYITSEEYKELLALTERNSRQLARFISYLKNHPQNHQIHEGLTEYEV